MGSEPPPVEPRIHPLPSLAPLSRSPLTLAKGAVVYKHSLGRVGIVAKRDPDHDGFLCVSADTHTFHIRPHLPHSFIILRDPDGKPVTQSSSRGHPPPSAPSSAASDAYPPPPKGISDEDLTLLRDSLDTYLSRAEELGGNTDWLRHVWTLEEDGADELKPEMVSLVLQLGAGSSGYGAVSRLLAVNAATPDPPLAHIAALNVDRRMLELLFQYGAQADEAYFMPAFDGCTPLQVLAGLCEHKLLGPIFEAQGVAAAAGHPSGIAPNAVPAEFLKCAVGLHRREEVGWVLGAPPNQTTRGGVSESERRSSVTPSPPPDADDLAASWPFYPTMVDLEPVVKPPRDPVFFPPTTSFVNGAYPPSPNSVLGSSPGTLAPPPHIPGSPLVSSGSVNPARFHPPPSPRLQPTLHTPAQSQLAHSLLRERRAALLDCARLLLAAGANTAHVNDFGVPVLHSAMASKNDDLCMLLVEGPSWPWYELPETVGNPLHGVAVWGPFLAKTTAVVVGRVAKMDEETRKKTLEMVDRDGFCPLHRAAISGNYEFVKTLVNDLGADPNIPTGTDGANPLILAATFGHPRTVSALLELGADIDIADDRGWTAADVAHGLEYSECLALLVEAGGEAETAGPGGLYHCGNVAGGCTKVEETRSEFPRCKKCETRRYCSYECGKEDFYVGSHKLMCRGDKGMGRTIHQRPATSSDNHGAVGSTPPVAIPPANLVVGSGGSGPGSFGTSFSLLNLVEIKKS